jgi:maltose/moltooligosaccharide transporter
MIFPTLKGARGGRFAGRLDAVEDWRFRMGTPTFCWRRTFFLGLVTYAASAAAPVFDTFVPIFLQAGHPLWVNRSGFSAEVAGFGLAPSLAFFIMTWDNVFNLLMHPWVGACSDRTWNRWGRRKPWIMAGVPMAALGLLLMPMARSVAMMAVAIIVFDLGRAVFVPPVIAWLGDLYLYRRRVQGRHPIAREVRFGGDLLVHQGVASWGWSVSREHGFRAVGRSCEFFCTRLKISTCNQHR